MPPEERKAARPKLSSVSLVREAATQLYEHRATLYLALILPVFCVLAIRVARVAYALSIEDVGGLTSLALIPFHFANVPFYVMFATICHRVVLLGNDSLPNWWGLFWSMRETRFLGWLLMLGAIAFLVSLPLYYLLYVLPAVLLPSSGATWFILFAWPAVSFLLYVVPSAYLDSRLAMVLPAAAIGNQFDPIMSWKSTRGNSKAIFLALLIPIVITDVIDLLLFRLLLLNLLPDFNLLLLTVLRGLLYFPLIAVGVVIITIAYRELVLSTEDEATAEDRSE